MNEETLERLRGVISKSATLIQMTLNSVDVEKQLRMLEFIMYLSKIIQQECKDFLSMEIIQNNEQLRTLFKQLDELRWQR